MSRRSNYSKKILKILANKPAVSVEAIKEAENPKVSYALARSIKNMAGGGYVEVISSGRENYLRLTKKGKLKLDTLSLYGSDMPVPQTWDGRWRIIILDLGEERKSEREALRYLLKKANFVCIKNTVWASPYPYEHLFENIKKDLGLSTELMIIVSDNLDPETKLAFLEALKK
jgi:DNA-binding transcriptional regulator PaaX